MPYIGKEVRADYDELTIKKFRDWMRTRARQGESKTLPGDINWLISSVIWAVFDVNPSYRAGNEIMGILESVKQEFYRKKLGPYEDKKIEENGDL